MKTMRKDLIGGVFFVLLGVIILVYAQQIVLRPNLTEPGGRLFPQITGFGMIICGLGMAFYKIPGGNRERGISFNKNELIRLMIFFGILIAYFVIMKIFGYLIATPLFCFTLIQVLKRDRKVSKITTAIVSVLVTAIIYIMFYFAFYIYLPTGIIFG